MKFVGSKTIICVVGCILSGSLAFFGHRFQIEILQSLSPQALFVIGFFTVLVSNWLFHFCSLDTPSASDFRLSHDSTLREGEQVLLNWKTFRLVIAHETEGLTATFSPLVLRVLSFGICLFIALLCFDTRAIDLMFKIPQRIMRAGNRICPKEEDLFQKKEALIKPDCAFIYKAYRLGYAKSLGSCAPENEETRNADVCTLRQFDEPYLHYSARLFFEALTKFKNEWLGPDLKKSIEVRWQWQLQHSGALLGEFRNVLEGVPKASHHIFTNLPDPNSQFAVQWRDLLNHRSCYAKYHKLPNTFQAEPEDPSALAKLFDHTYGQLLFNPQYATPVGSCKEFVIHWNSPDNSCDKLSKSPETFLSSVGALNVVHFVLDRLKELTEMKRLKNQHELKADAIVSFQCFMVSSQQVSPSVKTFTFSLRDHQFKANEIQLVAQVKAGQVSMYKALCKMLDENFNYAGFLSHGNLASPAAAPTGGTGFFSDSPYALLRLEYLKDVDIFQGQDWLQERPDILEIYPYYHHLYHFIDVFRQQYKLKRTRL